MSKALNLCPAESRGFPTCVILSHINVEQVFLHLDSEAPSGPLPNLHPPLFPHQTTLQTGGRGGLECILPCVMWLFAEKWVDLALQCHTHIHTLVLAELEVCETDLLSAGGLGPLHHFLQTENRGSSQLKPGWDNNEPSSNHHHLIYSNCCL